MTSLEFPLIVRSRLPGDKYRPLGAPGSKKLKEILRAKKVPRAERDTLPGVCVRKADRLGPWSSGRRALPAQAATSILIIEKVYGKSPDPPFVKGRGLSAALA